MRGLEAGPLIMHICCSYHWPNGILYYSIDAAFSAAERAVIASGFTHVEENSCIRLSSSKCYLTSQFSLRFVARTDQHDYVDIVPGGGGCYAQIPYRAGRGRMEIGLQQNGCVYLKVVVHELLHSLGFMHEQCRPDRDQYIDMHWGKDRNSKLHITQYMTSRQHPGRGRWAVLHQLLGGLRPAVL